MEANDNATEAWEFFGPCIPAIRFSAFHGSEQCSPARLA
jgi:hypothetical protein